MALTLSISPNDYQLSRLPVWAKLTTNNYITTAGVKAALTITGSGTGATAGQIVTLPFNGRTLVFTFAASLDGTGLTLRTPTGTVAQLMAALAEDFATNYYLADEFDITSDATHVYFTAKATGSTYSFIAPSTDATGLAIGTNTAGVTEVVRDNFKVLLDVFVEQTYGSGTYTKVHGQQIEPISNVSEFDIHDALHAQLGTDRPAYMLNDITKCTSILKQFFIRYAEQYGSDPVPQAVTQSSNFKILKGGLSFLENGYTQVDLSYFTTHKKFLTWQPSTKTVTTDMQDYVYFLVPSGMTSIKLLVKQYYTDGTSETITQQTKTGAAALEIYIIPTGYPQIVTPATGKTVSKYEVWLTNQSDVVKSEVFTYNVSSKPVFENRYFLIENSLAGAWETLRCTGVNEETITAQSTVTQKILQRGYDYQDGEFEKIASTGQNIFKQSTGWKTKAEIQWLEELLYSKNIVEDIAGEFRPIIVNADNILKYTNKQNLYAITFEYAYAFTNVAPKGAIANPDEGGTS